MTSFAAPAISGPRGSLGIHDPSTIIKHKGRYYMYGTGRGIISKYSDDGVLWKDGPPVFATTPAWVTNAAPGFNGDFWAPDIAFINGKFCLYYSVSSWGSQQSGIGLVTNPTLDPSDPNYLWTDQGIVIQSFIGSAYNTIDPCVTFDANGNPWLAYGSYWNGIYLTQLDPVTGKRISPGSTLTHLAYNTSIEAACLYRRGGYYYLFVNWGSCCDGVNSTYNVRVGRSTSITGPYLDRNGVDMRTPGGTSFMEASGKYAGPGHIGILNENGQDWFSYHYYDAGDYSSGYGGYGAAKFDLAPLSWTADNWPVPQARDWSAIYNFDADARDENGQYYGMVLGGTIQTDPTRGRVLNLNGTNQLARLPAGLANARTFAAVVKWNGGGAWQRIFDFGVNTANYIMLTPSSDTGRLRCDIRILNNTQILQWTNSLPVGVWTHVAVTLDGTRGVLYVNGNAVATNSTMIFSPLQTRAETNHLGRSKFVADPDFNGQISSFRVYSRVLSAAEIASPLPVILVKANGEFAGSPIRRFADSSYSPGSVIAFNGHATDFNDLPIPASRLSWRIHYIQDGQTNLLSNSEFGIQNSEFSSDGTFTVPTNSGAGVYLISLTATNLAGRISTDTAMVTPANPPAPWSSYFPFTADASDANGHFNGTLNGGASIQNDAERGNVLNLSGTNQYVSLPAGITTSSWRIGETATVAASPSCWLTFMAWVKWNGGAAWQRILDFGNDTTRYCVLTPAAANGKLRFNISLNSIPGEQIIDAPGPLPVGEWTHVAVVLDGERGVLYTNGVPVATNAALNLVPADLNATNLWFGRSQWPDPSFNGQLSSVRMFSRPLSATEIVAPIATIAQPRHGGIYRPGEVIQFNGGAVDFYDRTLAATSLTWTVQWRSNTTAMTVLGPVPGVTNGSFAIPLTGGLASNGYYRIQLVATDPADAGRKGTNYVDVFPATTLNTDWASFYPFTSNALDASNRFNGSFVNGASIVIDPVRANVANLGGGSQYVNLAPGAGALNTFSAWVKWNGGPAWQRILDFGVDTTRWLYVTPRDGSGFLHCAITTDGTRFNRVLQTQMVFPTNEWVHLAVMFDGRQGVLYTNGQPAAVHNSVNLLPSDIGVTRAWLGRSQFPADAYFNGRLDSVRLNSRALTLSEITAPTPIITAPGVSALYAGGDTISYAGRATDYSDAALPASAFSWSAEFRQDGQSAAVFGPLVGSTNGSFVISTNAPLSTNVAYRIRLLVTDANGNQQSTYTDVLPRLTALGFDTVPSGLQLQFDGQVINTPSSIVTVAGMARTLNAPSPQNLSGSNYNFVLWSDGAAMSHSINVPTNNVTFTASFVQPTIGIAGDTTQLALNWPGWASSLQLYSATNLSPPVNWSVVTNAPINSNGVQALSLPVAGDQEFFRLAPR
ncbi:MAG TPA: LamG-like jellyroll fold domain-containing protein [Verrucomicrobiae bacterium]|nr:LamG-like jellyroll fold domain-containing protein [Verrucomicrobiae bacterium]